MKCNCEGDCPEDYHLRCDYEVYQSKDNYLTFDLKGHHEFYGFKTDENGQRCKCDYEVSQLIFDDDYRLKYNYEDSQLKYDNVHLKCHTYKVYHLKLMIIMIYRVVTIRFVS